MITLGATRKANALIARALKHFENCSETELDVSDEDKITAGRFSRLLEANIMTIILGEPADDL